MDPPNGQFCKGCSYLMTAIISIILIVSYTIYVIARASNGASFTKGDIVCAAILISFGTVILIVMLICLCLETQYCRQKNERVITVPSRRMKRVPKVFGDDCAICLDEKNSAMTTIVGLSCKHTFHKSCVKEWMIHKSPLTCPECRQPSKKFSSKTMISDLISTLTAKKKKEKTAQMTYV
ncbi:Hypothetical predicted protein [Mytilus galloprovincialis]|uniref:RING-type domain-containing protein n=1 Tax=Mytilus galloprovincialis TaxID=29158 RepID=A0A8B6C9Z6_MYTGA|nr:Hypothetical predicted protein [Mytilus galloprovincialis]